MTKQGYINQQKILQNRLSNTWIQPLYSAMFLQVRRVINAINERGIEAGKELNNQIYFNHKLAEVIRGLYRSAYLMATPRTVIEKRLIPTTTLDAITYLDEHLLEKVVLPISETTRKHIAEVLQEAVAGGWGVNKTVARLKENGIPKWRTKMIIRTESVRALNFSQLKAAGNEDFEVTKTWIAVEDTRTRHTHREVDGQKIVWEDEFTNGCFYPGDPNAPASETINCRCTLSYAYLKDAEGNRVPKYQRQTG